MVSKVCEKYWMGICFLYWITGRELRNKEIIILKRDLISNRD